MKTIILILSLLLLTSCTKFRYDVTYEKCNGHIGSYTTFEKPYYSNRDRFIYEWDWIRNVCDFSFIKTEIWK